jgi:hypothetical protein
VPARHPHAFPALADGEAQTGAALTLVLEPSTWWNCRKSAPDAPRMPGPVSVTLTAKCPLTATAITHTSEYR